MGVILLAAVGIREGRWFVFAKRFREVEPGLLRSGQLEAWPYARVIEEHHIKTVLRLNPLAPGDRRRDVEAEVVREHGLEFLEVPMVNGSGLVPYPDLERAADVLAERQRWPLLFHCAAGDRRSSAVQAVYRMRHCGWSWEQAAREIEEQGLRPSSSDRLFDHLKGYYDERILARGSVAGEG